MDAQPSKKPFSLKQSEALKKETGEIQTHAMDPGFEGNVLSLAAGKIWEFHL